MANLPFRLILIILTFSYVSLGKAQSVQNIADLGMDLQASGLLESSIGHIGIGFDYEKIGLYRFSDQGVVLDHRVLDLGIDIPDLQNYFTDFKEIAPGEFIACGRPLTIAPTQTYGGFLFRYDYLNDVVIWAHHFDHFSPMTMQLFGNPVDTICLYGYGDQASTFDISQYRFCEPSTGNTLSYQEFNWSGGISNIMQLQVSLKHADGVYCVSRNSYAGGGQDKMRISMTKIDASNNVEFLRYYLNPISANARHYVSGLIEGPDGLAIYGRGDYNGTQIDKDVFIIETDDEGVSTSTLMLNGPNFFRSYDIYRYGNGFLCTGALNEGSGDDLFILYVNDNDELEWVKKTNLAADESNFNFVMNSSTLIGDELTILTNSNNLSPGGETDIMFIRQNITDFESDCCDIWEDYGGVNLSVLTPFDGLAPTAAAVSQESIEVINPVPVDIAIGQQSLCSNSYETYETEVTICEMDSVLFGGQYYMDPGTYTDTVACDSVAILQLDVLPFPVFDLGADITICLGDEVSIYSPLVSGSYLWSDGTVADSINVDYGGYIWLEMGNGECTFRDSLEVTVLDDLLFDLGDDVSICPGEEISIYSPIVSDDYLWSDGSTEDSLNVGSGGMVWLEVSNDECSYRDSLLVSVVEELVFDLGEDLTICPNELINIASPIVSDEYLWSDGSVLNNIDVDSAAIVWLELYNEQCPFRDSLVVSELAEIPFDLGPDFSICPGEMVSIYSPEVSDDYLWSDGAVVDSINVDYGGYIWLEMSLGDCPYRDSVLVSVFEELQVDLGEDFSICEGDSVLITPEFSGDSIPDYLEWHDGTSALSFMVFTAGTYSLLADNGNCQGFDSVRVEVDTIPAVEDIYEFMVCENGFLDMTELPEEYVYTLNGQDLAAFPFTENGLYEVQVTNGECQSTSALIMDVIVTPDVDIGDDFAMCEGEYKVIVPSFTYPGFVWQDGSITPYFVASEGGDYTYTLVNECGIFGDSLSVELQLCDTSLYIPNAFTPDGDGVNDLFKAEGSGISQFNMEIYDKWGNLVFESDSLGQAWNGSVNGGDYYAADDIYIYRIVYEYNPSLPFVKERGTRELVGHVLLAR